MKISLYSPLIEKMGNTILFMLLFISLFLLETRHFMYCIRIFFLYSSKELYNAAACIWILPPTEKVKGHH